MFFFLASGDAPSGRPSTVAVFPGEFFWLRVAQTVRLWVDIYV